jgi:predicted nucleic acid-binding protein
METVIADTGPLVAFLRRDDADHAWAAERFRELTTPLVTCDAVLSEALFLLSQSAGGARKLLDLVDRGLVVPSFDLAAELKAVSQLLRRFEDVPMSLADACLVRMAELHDDARVFALDSDFKVYRRHRRQVIPLLYPG